jgi:hypothetical protein
MVHAMISPYTCPPELTHRPADSCLPAGKDPGSAFGPESGPLATGSISVVYWVPGPRSRPTPIQPD